jgi:hypothetical protein
MKMFWVSFILFTFFGIKEKESLVRESSFWRIIMWEIDGSKRGWHVYGSKCIFVWLIIDQSEESWLLKVFKAVQGFIAFGFLIISENYILWYELEQL